jgi:hypothetical protein
MVQVTLRTVRTAIHEADESPRKREKTTRFARAQTPRTPSPEV